MKYSFNLNFNKYDIIDFVIENNSKIFKSNDNKYSTSDILWYNSQEFLKNKKYVKYKIKNNMYGLFSITNKMQLALNFNKIKGFFKKDYEFFPQTYNIPYEYQIVKNNYKNDKNINFIIKPNNSSQGKGIKIINNINKLEFNKSVAQLYINEPYWISKKKFDLRIYSFIKIINNKLHIYIYDEGMVRFSTENYEIPNNENLNNNYIHLTNYAINSKKPNICFEQVGMFELYNSYVKKYESSLENNSSNRDKICIKYLFSTILKNNFNEIQKNNIKNQINDIITKTIIIAIPNLKNSNNNNNFHLLGFDLLIDKSLKVWLLEVNKNPSLYCQTNIDFNLKYNLIWNIFNNLLKINNNSCKLKLLYTENFKINKINNIYRKIDENENNGNLSVKKENKLTMTKINFLKKNKKTTQLNFFNNHWDNYKNKYEKYTLGIQYKFDEFNGLRKDKTSKFIINKNRQMLQKSNYKYSNILKIYLNK